MTYKIVKNFPNQFFVDKIAPMVSIYQETSRQLSNNKRDVMVFKDLIKGVETSLKEKYVTKDIKRLISMLDNIMKESTFWSHSLEGIALFATLDECIIYRLERPIKTFAAVADSFHLKPLIEYHQFVKTFEILDIDGQSFQILEGTPYHLNKIELDDDVKTTMEEILGDMRTKSYLTHGTYGGSSNKSVYHGHGGKSDEIEIDLEKFFRRVDAFVTEKVSKVSKLPMILLAPAEHHALFMSITNNSFLENKAIAGTYKSIGQDGLIEHITSHADQLFKAKKDQLIEQYQTFRSADKGSSQLIEIIIAAIDKRIETLFIEKNRIISGKIDVINKTMNTEALSNPDIDDILDDLGQLVLEKGGEVFIVSKESMPTDSGVAAIYRY